MGQSRKRGGKVIAVVVHDEDGIGAFILRVLNGNDIVMRDIARGSPALFMDPFDNTALEGILEGAADEIFFRLPFA